MRADSVQAESWQPILEDDSLPRVLSDPLLEELVPQPFSGPRPSGTPRGRDRTTPAAIKKEPVRELRPGPAPPISYVLVVERRLLLLIGRRGP